MTWNDVLASVRTWFAVAIDGEDWVGLVREGTRIKLVRLVHLGRPFVAVIGDVFEATRLDAEAVLALNNALSIGALELEDHRLLLRAMLPLAGLDDIDLRRVILHVCRQVAHMQKMLPAVAPSPAAFVHYAD